MSDFSLLDALPSKSEWCDGDMGTDSQSSDMEMIPDEVFKLDERLDLVVSHNPRNLREVATLVLLINKLNKRHTEAERCRMIVDSVIQMDVVQRVESSNNNQKTNLFNRCGSWECNLIDNEKKDIVCKMNFTNLKLHAVTLQAGNCEHKVNFKLVSYASCGAGKTVILSVTRHKLFISCSMNGDKAELNLEKCEPSVLNVISKETNLDRFLFYLVEMEINGNRFESVKCPGWFISTSYQEENQPLEMCQVDTANRVSAFNIVSGRN